MGDRVVQVMSLCCHFDKKWTVEMSTATCDSLWQSASELQVPTGSLQVATGSHRHRVGKQKCNFRDFGDTICFWNDFTTMHHAICELFIFTSVYKQNGRSGDTSDATLLSL